MSKATRKVFEEIKSGESMGAVQALREGISEGVGAFLSAAKEVGGQIWDGVAPMANHGRTEMAAALFQGSHFIMYMKGQEGIEQGQDQVPDNGLPIETVKPPEVQQERAGMEM